MRITLMNEESTSAPVIEFPCSYPIKVVANSHPELVARGRDDPAGL